MKISSNKFLIVYFLSTFFFFEVTVKGQSNDEVNENNRAIQKVGLFFRVGPVFQDNSVLSSMLYGESSKLNSDVYFSSGVEFKIVSRRNIYVVIGGESRQYKQSVNKSDNLRVNEGYIIGGLGYNFKLSRSVDIIPNLGVAVKSSDILLTRDSLNPSNNIQDYINGSSDTYRLIMERWYARIGVSAMYNFDLKNDLIYLPLSIGLNIEYLQSLSKAKWRNSADRVIENSKFDAFNNNFYAGLTVGLWF